MPGAARRENRIGPAALVVGLALLCSLAWAGQARAQVTAQPMMLEAGAAPGGRAKVSFTLTNGVAWSYAVTTQIADLDLSASGFPSPAPERREYGASPWVTTTPASFTLSPGRTVTVTGELRPPRGLAGTYSAMVSWILEGKPRPGTVSRLRLNAVLLVRVGAGRGAQTRISVRSVDIMPTREKGGGAWQVRVPVHNDGAFAVHVSGSVAMKLVGGRTVATVAVSSGQGIVLPGGTRDLIGSGRGALRDGAYVAAASVGPSPGRVAARYVGYFVLRNGVVEARPPDEASLQAAASLVPPLTAGRDALQLVTARGGSTSSSLQVWSNASVPLTVRASVVAVLPGEANADTLPRAFPEGRCLPQLFSVSPPSGQLQPGRASSFRISARLGREAAGEYYAYLVLSPEKAGAGAALPSTVVLLAVVAKGTDAVSAQITSATMRASASAPPVFSIQVMNTGNVAGSFNGTIVLIDAEGLEARREAFEVPGPLLPSLSATAKVALGRRLAAGTYQVRVTVARGDKTLASKEQPVNVR